MENIKTTKVFVYGTLKKGFHNHRCLNNSKQIGEGWLYGFEMWRNFVPYVKRSENKESKVFGEIYEVSIDTLINSLDILEGHPYFYKREFIEDQLNGVWVYLCDSGDSFVKNGIFI